ncbi:DUF2993 domain-containing protein [Brasilonema octagenarum UFV-E1]|uniref:DUF2993 domain-containing protein n=1 Tax=Brasilonema sennae CENA114 TaxID=415709 RepID=A0A856MG17_9CYAN|nr:DUF2993 domain-containing protein [Brasilonema sennae]QDL09180.1 DUF2993 domain-containing protein [Brasilonema sennae CENA114]QDL15538.1 DUF2993 domain-containing protein [Brasilonema octagenarum UFV-E1]
MSEDQRIEEKMLSREAEKQLSKQLDTADKIDVDIQTDFLKLLQGMVDGVSVEGQGLVKQDIRIQEIKLQIDNVAVNPFSVLFGQVELNEPVNITTRVVMTEKDINRAMISEFIRSKMPTFKFNADGKTVSLYPEEIQMKLLEDNKMTVALKVTLTEDGNTRPLSFTAQYSPRTDEKPIILEYFNCTQGEGISLEVVVALMQKVKELVKLPSFKYENIVLQIRKMEIQKEIMILLVDARLKKLPSF